MTTGPAAPPPVPLRSDLPVAGLLGLLALVVRVGFLLAQELPPYDPWRHLVLLRNLQAGLGFTLFGGEPYVWYSPIWYYLCVPLPAWIGMDGLAAFCSAAAVPCLYLALRRSRTTGALVAAALLASAGPVVAYTCHYGPEGLALLLTVLALLACTLRPGLWGALTAGLLFGTALVLRMNFAFSLFLFLPSTGRPRRAAALLSGIALPIVAQWWRNHRIIASRPFVFTWDGLATPTADFNLLSTLVIQLHPDVGEALRRLHEAVIPRPEWIVGPDGPAWGLMLFVACGLIGLLVSRRFELMLAGLLPMAYFLFLDRSLSAHFFRIYLPLFLPFFLATGIVAERGFRRGGHRRWTSVALVAATMLSGAALLRPQRIGSLEALTAPPALLAESAYLVNSGRFHPESLIYRYPDRRFIGLPLDPADLEALLAEFPEYRRILWHEFTIQGELRERIRAGGGWTLEDSARNAAGRTYEVWRPARTPAP